MWIKLDRNLTESAVMMRCVGVPTPKDAGGVYSRYATCINLFIHSANDLSWKDAKDLSRFIHMPIKSCERVWAICLEMGVLKEISPSQYNAKQWLADNGFMGRRESVQGGSCNSFLAPTTSTRSKNQWV